MARTSSRRLFRYRIGYGIADRRHDNINGVTVEDGKQD
ncbi:hypothetical protein BJ997_001654 [Cryobacterium roopkundense]|uniref:Uncharacterized protein n=1 Tax=Cryobacterium roopkundense TaxID=1001240 RepID=A0A7W9E3I3_9MICO|nr:hypothetical protein [Cryobacterium roopkundense]